MNTLRRSSSFSASGLTSWILSLATRMLARSLNMPEPLVRVTGVFVFARVQAVESSVGKTLCPKRLLRQLQNRRGLPARRPFTRPSHQGERS